MIRSRKTPDCICPYCLHRLDEVSDLMSGRVPKPGDASLCVYCGQFLILGPDMTVRRPTAEEYARLLDNERLLGQQATLQRDIAERNHET